jgi:hypothetical protein
VDVMKRGLLKLLHVREFSKEAQFKNPSRSLVRNSLHVSNCLCVFVNHSVEITHPASRCIISCQRLDFDSPSCDCAPPSCPSHISSFPNFGSLPYRQPLKSPCFRLAGSSRRVLLVHVLRCVAGRGLVQVLDVGGRSPRLRAHTMMQATNNSIDSSGASARACGRTSQ